MLRSVVPAESASPDKRYLAAEPRADEIRAQLAAMLLRAEFSASARNRRFLSYVIEETLQGRSGRIKAYTIALAVFDRDQNFDPLVDPIVRIEASRLRRAIEHYYLTAGKDDHVRIDMPKGSYVPKFSYHEADEPAGERVIVDSITSTAPIGTSTPRMARPAAFLHRRLGAYALVAATVIGLVAWLTANDFDWHRSLPQGAKYSQAPTIFVMPFTSAPQAAPDALIAAGLTYDIISTLTRFEDLFVYGPVTSFRSGQADDSPIPDTDYLLNGTVHTGDGALALNIVLTDRRSGRNIWAMQKEWPVTPDDIDNATNAITGEVATIIAQPDGIIQEEFQKRIAGKSAASLNSYECVVRFRQAWREYRQGDFNEIEACLTRTIADDPTYAPAYSALALLNIDRYRFGASISDDSLTEALRLASRAKELEPNASHPYLPLSLAYWFKHDIDKSLDLAERGLERNPENAELLADLGLRYALLGRWSQSEPLISEAFKRDPAAPSGYHLGHFLYAYMRGDYDLALNEAMEIDAPFVIYGHLATVAAYGKLGDVAAAKPVINRILQVDPEYARKVREDLEKRNVAPQLITELIDGLRKAGF
jgi:TolB-like protein